jgi:hypothetical protein
MFQDDVTAAAVDDAGVLGRRYRPAFPRISPYTTTMYEYLTNHYPVTVAAA